MALHRDIYWVGRQWAVTGFGVQAIDQRLKGAFDIEASRLWDEALSEPVRAEAWVNVADLDKALAVARTRFQEPPKPLVESVPDLIQHPPPAPSPTPTPHPIETGLQVSEAGAGAVEEGPASPPLFQLQIQGRLARFVPQWRIRR